MRKSYRFLFMAYITLNIFLLSFVALSLFSHSFKAQLDQYWFSAEPQASVKYSLMFFFFAMIVASVLTLAYVFRINYLGDTRLKTNELGVIDIEVRALENIALHAAKQAKAGLRRANVKVYSDHNKGIKVEIFVHLDTDIEIPAQMLKIQERVKKDVERYTDIPVTEVQVRVTKVELSGTKVD